MILNIQHDDSVIFHHSSNAAHVDMYVGVMSSCIVCAPSDPSWRTGVMSADIMSMDFHTNIVIGPVYYHDDSCHYIIKYSVLVYEVNCITHMIYIT